MVTCNNSEEILVFKCFHSRRTTIISTFPTPSSTVHDPSPLPPSLLFFSPTGRAHSTEARQDLFFCRCPAIMTHSQRNNRQGAKSLMAILNSSAATQKNTPLCRYFRGPQKDWFVKIFFYLRRVTFAYWQFAVTITLTNSEWLKENGVKIKT